MPVGVYRVLDGRGNEMGREEFRCAPGPAGWRYVSTIQTTDPEPHAEIVDLAVDGDWRPMRVRIDSGSHDILLGRHDDRFAGVRDGQPLDLPATDDVDYLSPCFNAATVNRVGASAQIEVTYLDPITCEPHPLRQRYERIADEEVATPAGSFRATHWTYATEGLPAPLHLWVAQDVVVAYEGLFELVELEPGPRGPFPL